MSSIFSISSVTDAGMAAMQEALDHGYTMTFTAMKTGNGIYTAGEDVTGRTSLKSFKNSYTIGSMDEDAHGATLSAVFANYDGDNILVNQDYNINEIGLFCEVNSVEVLYALAAVPNDEGMVMPAYDVAAQNLTQFMQDWYVANSNDAQITIDPSGAYVLVTDIVDNLTSSVSTKPLSANQGKVLNDAKQPKTLATPITIGGTSQTTVEGALGALNTTKAERGDITSIICTGATNNTGNTITKGTFFYLNDVLCKALADIADGATFTLNTNYKTVTTGEELAELNSKTIQRVLLWTNSNPSESFVVQSVPLDLSGYDEIEIVRDGSSSNNAAGNMFITNTVGNIGTLFAGYPVPNNSEMRFRGRNATITSTGIDFSDAWYCVVKANNITFNTLNNDMVPYKIFGIKYA